MESESPVKRCHMKKNSVGTATSSREKLLPRDVMRLLEEEGMILQCPTGPCDTQKVLESLANVAAILDGMEGGGRPTLFSIMWAFQQSGLSIVPKSSMQVYRAAGGAGTKSTLFTILESMQKAVGQCGLNQTFRDALLATPHWLGLTEERIGNDFSIRETVPIHHRDWLSFSTEPASSHSTRGFRNGFRSQVYGPVEDQGGGYAKAVAHMCAPSSAKNEGTTAILCSTVGLMFESLHGDQCICEEKTFSAVLHTLNFPVMDKESCRDLGRDTMQELALAVCKMLAKDSGAKIIAKGEKNNANEDEVTRVYVLLHESYFAVITASYAVNDQIKMDLPRKRDGLHGVHVIICSEYMQYKLASLLHAITVINRVVDKIEGSKFEKVLEEIERRCPDGLD